MLRFALLAFSVVVVVVVAVACGASSSSGAIEPGPPAVTAGDPSCPVEVPGTSVTVEDTDTGAALVFVTTGDIAEVRRRAAALAQTHNEHHGKMGPLPTGSEPAGGGHAGHDMSGHAEHGGAGSGASGAERAGHAGDAGDAGGMIKVHAKAEVKDIVGGASIAFITMPGDVAAIQSELRTHAQHLATGKCAMDAHGAHAASSEPEKLAPVEPPAPDPAQVKAELLAAETAAYERARPVFDKFCAKCHTNGGKNASAKKLAHFDMTTYPFGGHHAGEISATIRKVLAIGGGKPTMPADQKGAVKGDELALIEAWAVAFDASHAGGAHERMTGHGGHHGH